MADDGYRPFAGLRVCDLAQGIAGPFVGMMLAQYGADVVKIESVEGDWIRNMGGRVAGDHSAQSLANNRGKRSIALDLKNPRALSVARRLAAEADVVTQSFRPGVIERLGLGYDDVRAVNPDVVYLSVSGFGAHGPLAAKPATDAILQGFSGLQSITRDADGTPLRVGMAIIDYVTGLYALQAVMAALAGRAAKGAGGGGGRHVEASLMQAAFGVQAGQFIRHHVQGAQPPANGVPIGTFRTADGWLNIAATKPQSFAVVCDALGLPDLKHRPEYDTHQKRVWRSAEINAELAPALATRPTAAWIALLEPLDVMCTRVNDYGDVLGDAHVNEIGAFAWVEQPDVGRMPVPNPAGPAPLAPGETRAVSPRIGEHTAEILAGLGYDRDEIEALARDGAAGPV